MAVPAMGEAVRATARRPDMTDLVVMGLVMMDRAMMDRAMMDRAMMDRAMMGLVRVASQRGRVARRVGIFSPAPSGRRPSGKRDHNGCRYRRSASATTMRRVTRPMRRRERSGCTAIMPSRPLWRIRPGGCGVCC
jgi:hypothetical protein